MGGSNENWGALVREDPDTAGLWDAGAPLPDKGQRKEFDAFLKAKRIDRAALARTGARLAEADGDVILFAWPGGAKYRNFVTDKRWNSVGPTWRRAHIMPAFDGRDAVVLLVAEGETDAARLSELYPFADVALLPLGADYIPSNLPQQCADYTAVYGCQDADKAGDAGFDRLREHVPQLVRHRPPESEDGDWNAFPLKEKPPGLPKPPDACGSIVFEDAAAMLRAGIPEPVQLIPGVMYEGAVHWIDAHPGSGKTTILMAWCLELMAEGRHVVWLDYEGGMAPTLRRFSAVGLGAELAASHFHYAGFPPDAESSLAAVADRFPGAVVVFDSASKSLSFSGLDENANAEVVKWTVKLVQGAKKFGLTLAIIDHITKNGEGSQYARGAGTKEADTDVHWRVIKQIEFDRNNPGVVMLVRKKDREGFFPQCQWFAVGDGKGGLPVIPCEPPQDEPQLDSGPAKPHNPRNKPAY